VARRVYIFRPWQLVVHDTATDGSSKATQVRGVRLAAHDIALKMSLRSLQGPAWDAPQASRVGVKATPQGPLAVRAKKVTHAHHAFNKSQDHLSDQSNQRGPSAAAKLATMNLLKAKP
jgi:hypothetical protein